MRRTSLQCRLSQHPEIIYIISSIDSDSEVRNMRTSMALMKEMNSMFSTGEDYIRDNTHISRSQRTWFARIEEKVCVIKC